MVSGGSVVLIEGRQPVREALRAGRKISRLLVAVGADDKGTLAEILRLAAESGVRVERVDRESLDALAESRAHQGVLAEAAPLQNRSWREGVARATKAGRPPLVLALDGVEDPQNLGALLRSAEVFGADAVLLPKRRSAPLSAVALKASAGAAEHLVIDQVSSLERALADVRKEGLWIVSLAGEGETSVDACELLGEPVAVVIGAEGAGVSHLIRQRSDQIVRIPTTGRVESLNASAAGAVVLWEAARRRLVRKY